MNNLNQWEKKKMKKLIIMLVAAAMSVGFGSAVLAGSCGGGDHKHDKCACGYEKGSEECKKACAKEDTKEEKKEVSTEKAN
jgi:hypothetical protein